MLQNKRRRHSIVFFEYLILILLLLKIETTTSYRYGIQSLDEHSSLKSNYYCHWIYLKTDATVKQRKSYIFSALHCIYESSVCSKLIKIPIEILCVFFFIPLVECTVKFINVYSVFE